MADTRFLTADQIADAALSAGFTPEQAVTAVAVAFAESDGDALQVTTGNYKGRDRGLWQINSYYHPDVSDAQAFDPAGNARAAYVISSHGTSFKAWVAFTNGSYERFVDRARQGVWVAQNPTPVGVPTINVRNVEPGDGPSGAVRLVQRALNDVNRDLPGYARNPERGVFDAQTQADYDRFRRDVAKYRNWGGPAGLQSLTLLGQLSQMFHAAA